MASSHRASNPCQQSPKSVDRRQAKTSYATASSRLKRLFDACPAHGFAAHQTDDQGGQQKRA
jgi:hypothetical protein